MDAITTPSLSMPPVAVPIHPREQSARARLQCDGMNPMATIEVRGELFNVEVDGPVRGPALVLSNSIGTSMGMWDAQMPVLRERFRVLRYDGRGHHMASRAGGEFTIAQLAEESWLGNKNANRDCNHRTKRNDQVSGSTRIDCARKLESFVYRPRCHHSGADLHYNASLYVDQPFSVSEI